MIPAFFALPPFFFFFAYRGPVLRLFLTSPVRMYVPQVSTRRFLVVTCAYHPSVGLCPCVVCPVMSFQPPSLLAHHRTPLSLRPLLFSSPLSSASFPVLFPFLCTFSCPCLLFSAPFPVVVSSSLHLFLSLLHLLCIFSCRCLLFSASFLVCILGRVWVGGRRAAQTRLSYIHEHCRNTKKCVFGTGDLEAGMDLDGGGGGMGGENGGGGEGGDNASGCGGLLVSSCLGPALLVM